MQVNQRATPRGVFWSLAAPSIAGPMSASENRPPRMPRLTSVASGLACESRRQTAQTGITHEIVSLRLMAASSCWMNFRSADALTFHSCALDRHLRWSEKSDAEVGGSQTTPFLT